jgi:hypothetical protein
MGAAKRNYTFKKLPYFQILQVKRTTKQRTATMMQCIKVKDWPDEGLPSECYSILQDGIVLPKRQPGEKFIVNYTVMHQKEL